MNSQHIPDKFPKKHLFVAIQAIDNKIHETTHLPAVYETVALL